MALDQIASLEPGFPQADGGAGISGAGALVPLAALGLSACGGGGGAGDSPAPAPAPSAPPTRMLAARLLSQPSLSSTAAEAAQVQSAGYSRWLNEQMTMPRGSTHVQWLRSKGLDTVASNNNQAGADSMVWRMLLSSPDPLRQRVTLALSKIVVVSVSGIANTGFKQFAAAAFLDILEANAFGSYRTLLEQVSTSVAMGGYLTFKGSRNANASTGSLPDENYAREVMQLFSIGPIQLNPDGSAKLGSNGQPLETYVREDVSQMARVFTGWETNTAIGTADEHRRDSLHWSGPCAPIAMLSAFADTNSGRSPNDVADAMVDHGHLLGGHHAVPPATQIASNARPRKRRSRSRAAAGRTG